LPTYPFFLHVPVLIRCCPCPFGEIFFLNFERYPVTSPNSRIVITVDGLAASGKSSIARELARRLEFVHFSSGLLYRAVGAEALERGVELESEEAIGEFVESHKWDLAIDEQGEGRVAVDGVLVNRNLSDPRTSEAASCVGTSRRVRRALLEPQRRAFFPHSMVAEGRDLGTIIFPDAALKLFVEAPEEVRIARRVRQLQELRPEGQLIDDLMLRAEISERDKRDAERSIAPTIAAKDAFLVDNGSRSLTEVVDSLYALALSKGLVTGE